MHIKELAKIYGFAAIATVLIWSWVGWKMGLAAAVTVIILTLLETTFSADNAVVNSKVLSVMSPAWQRVFMTLGIFIAVFIVRFILPLVIVMSGAHLGFHQTLDLALNHPDEYANRLKNVEPAINAFGGTFLIMIALSYFIDYEKETHWLGFLERRLGRLGRFDNVTIFLTLAALLAINFTVDSSQHTTVLLAGVLAIALHAGLSLLNSIIGSQSDGGDISKKVGMAALASFLYLEILDASFSLDGVIGAFALTKSIILIMAGLGAGAVWVRAITIHLTRSKTLTKYVFLEHGAHWAIGLLGMIMLLKLYHAEFPEWLVGGIGLAFITAAIFWSKKSTKNDPAGAA